MVIGIKHLETLLATNCQLQFFWSVCFAESWTFCQKALSDVYAAHWQKKEKEKSACLCSVETLPCSLNYRVDEVYVMYSRSAGFWLSFSMN